MSLTRATYAWLMGAVGDDVLRDAVVQLVQHAPDLESLAEALQRFCIEMHRAGAAGLLFRRQGALEMVDWTRLAVAVRGTDVAGGQLLSSLLPQDPVSEPSVRYLDGPGQWMYADELAVRGGLVEPHTEFPDAPDGTGARSIFDAFGDEVEPAESGGVVDRADDEDTIDGSRRPSWIDSDVQFEHWRDLARDERRQDPSLSPPLPYPLEEGQPTPRV